MCGDAIKTGLRGNRLFGNVKVPVWENLLDLSHSVYSRNRHITPNADSFKTAASYLFVRNQDDSSHCEVHMRFSLRSSLRWSVFVFILTFIMAMIFSVISTILLENSVAIVGMFIVFSFIVIGVIFDTIGLAAAAANPTPFHAMGSERIKGSKQAIRVTRNADKFANFCNDVIGDITGVVSGAGATLVVIQFVTAMDISSLAVITAYTVIFTALVSALTVSGKALGKSFAIHYANELILGVGKVLYLLEHRFGLKLFHESGSKTNGKRGNTRVT